MSVTFIILQLPFSLERKVQTARTKTGETLGHGITTLEVDLSGCELSSVVNGLGLISDISNPGSHVKCMWLYVLEINFVHFCICELVGLTRPY